MVKHWIRRTGLLGVPIATVAMTPQQAAERDPFSPEAIASRRGRDLRLLPVAVASWAAVALTVVERVMWIAGVCMCVVVLSLGAFAYLRRSSPRGAQAVRRKERIQASLVMLGAAAFVAGALSASCAARMHVIERHPLVRESVSHAHPNTYQHTHTGIVAVAGMPKPLTSTGVMVPVRIEGLGTVPLFLSAVHAHGPGGAAQDLRPGQRIDVAFRVQQASQAAGQAAEARSQTHAGMIPVTLRATRSINSVEDPRGVWAVTHWLRSGLVAASDAMPGETGDVVPGMVVGDTTMQPQELRDDFVATGLSHLSAVSGANCAIVMATAMMVASMCGAGRWTRLAAAALALAGFVLLVGPEPSVLRAAVMGSIGLVAVATALWRDIVATACWAVLGLLWWDPGLSVNYGFVLSMVATVGIVILGPWWSRAVLWRWWRYMERRFHKRPPLWHAMLVRMVMVSAAADVVTAPVIMHMTGRMSVVAIPANVLVSWAVPIVTVCGLLLALLGALWVSVAAVPVVGALLHGLVLVAGLAAVPGGWWIQGVGRSLARCPHVEAPAGTVSMLCMLAGIAVIMALIRYRRSWWSPWALGMVLVVSAGVLRWGSVTLVIPTDTPEQWSVPERVDVRGLRVVETHDDTQTLRVQPPAADVIIDRTCGKSYGRPTLNPQGIPVIYPCRDGVRLVE
ncbi:ComEC/Rec2 family competence protein [Corynebacterium sp. 320]|uniref:ComEC/Rec2 family competence protein n=1 Tax=Corynebacterium TaxID=1716 RepID=UPI00125CCBFB|nr:MULTISPECIES: ComEC/Rec2 family competence protein [Corynebacterium]KAB1502389.1 ComEC/Rec2 family competence protein [Corynebacterium sp. 320]KAB1551389.1 ComEC/Rec2 family competence protein [Corynebacterium sp. 321]KAB1551782.1 ComEC/Rec2 family competence protein [Corynebacterium sp. 319]KAB3525996.1 ComEC/Rec2 family competence protein [Corynebacterium sp. 250]KAB3538777.1 ComEC/Rec2 family competence protein [Corynebacterium sp. 366]